MVKVFFGDDRVKATEAIRQFLGEGYEVIDCGELTETDLPTIFRGMTLFSDERRILLRDFLANKAVAEKLLDYLDTPFLVAILETKINKQTTLYKELKEKIEFLEFKMAPKQNFGVVFEIYRTAKKDGSKAVKMLEKIEAEEEPMMFLGLLVSQALKDYNAHPGVSEKRALKELSKVDMQLKTTSTQPWLILKSFLVRLSSF